MSVAHRISEAEYMRIVLADPDHTWELVEGQLREKPGMSWDHSQIVGLLNQLLRNQLDARQFTVFFDARVRRMTDSVFMPDIAVIPTEFGRDFAGRPGVLAIFSRPLPLIVEVWSASTGNYDVDAKIPEYQRRGDLEIWRIHPYERTLTAWVRQPDGAYRETLYRDGVVTPLALPSVTIALAELFAT
jgi:Uma2 family endonuclease